MTCRRTTTPAALPPPGAQAVQINTEGGCHLNSTMVLEALKQLDLVTAWTSCSSRTWATWCARAEFDVGEDAKITLLSVAEGDDKPEKYPLMFNLSRAMVLNKVDLLPYVDFDLERATTFARALNKGPGRVPGFLQDRGKGWRAWYGWLRKMRAAKKG